MTNTYEVIRKLVEEAAKECRIPVSEMEGVAEIMKELDNTQTELKVIKKGTAEMWENVKEEMVPDAVTCAGFIENEAEKLAIEAISLAVKAVTFSTAFKREGEGGWLY